MNKPHFPLNMPLFDRVDRTPAQDLAFGRGDLACAARFIRAAGHEEVARAMESLLSQLPPATVSPLGCHYCGGDVPLDQADLLEDRMCRRCADAYDAAAADRKRRMREARLAA